MKKPFKVGDRVRIYCAIEPFTGAIDSVFPSECLLIHVDDIFTGGLNINKQRIAHPKQCRRLKPKKKKEKMRVWLNEYSGEINYWALTSKEKEMADAIPRKDRTACIEFVEVKREEFKGK